MKDTIVVSEDIQELPETGEAVYVRKDGTKLKFFDGNFEKELPKGNKEITITL